MRRFSQNLESRRAGFIMVKWPVMTTSIIKSSPAVKHSFSSTPGIQKFSVLERKVQEAFEQGLSRAQEAVEVEKARTYLEVGKLIDQHLLINKKRADYGEKLIPRLAERTGKSRTLLYDCLRFARQTPILPARVELLPWGIYKGILGVKDAAEREKLLEKASRENWSTRDLAEYVQESEKKFLTGNQKEQRQDLVPKRGELYHYRIVQPEVPGKPLQVDLGFNAFVDIALPASRFKEGDIVISESLDRIKGRKGKYRIEKTGGSIPVKQSKLFTYWAYILHVIDADTLLAWMELGFGQGRKERLRLRGLNAPEGNTKMGKKAKAFAEATLQHSGWVIVTTTRAIDLHHRYLADVFTAPSPVSENSPETDWSSCLNKNLLESGFAEVV